MCNAFHVFAHPFSRVKGEYAGASSIGAVLANIHQLHIKVSMAIPLYHLIEITSSETRWVQIIRDDSTNPINHPGAMKYEIIIKIRKAELISRVVPASDESKEIIDKQLLVTHDTG